MANPNILINGDFRNPINQRMQTVYNTNGYSIDRWLLWNANTTLTVDNGYCTLTGDYNALVQNIEFPTRYSNTEVTLSAKVKGSGGGIEINLYSGELDKQLGKASINTTEWKEISFTCNIENLTDNSKRLSVTVAGAGAEYIDIEWVKLELGSNATPFVPRLYGEELALCQRYYFRNRWKTLRTALITSTELRLCEYNFPVIMRVPPTIRTIIAQPVTQVYVFDLSVYIVNPSLTQIAPMEIGIRNDAMCDFRFSISSIELKDYTIEIKDYAYEFDAEIY